MAGRKMFQTISTREQSRVVWPEGKQFAFTIFDDTDRATLENVSEVYALLADLGFRTTKTCWAVRGDPSVGEHPGQTCEDDDYLSWLQDLQTKGFEIGWHGACWQTSSRETTSRGLNLFASKFGHYPKIAANHVGAAEGLYWAENRFSGIHVPIYEFLTRGHNRGLYHGHIVGDELFWGDICLERIKYFRNFVFNGINTLRYCPYMPYYDPRRPFVRYWFAGSDGADVAKFNACLSEENQDKLEEERGAAIIYTHFAFKFIKDGKINPRFRFLMERLAKKGGWYVPAGTILDHLLSLRSHCEITNQQRASLERRWLFDRLLAQTASSVKNR